MSEVLQSLVTLEQYQASRSNIFPSVASLRWHLRGRKARLAGAGAIVMVAGRNMIAPELFDALVLQDGKQAAQRAAT